MKTSLIARVALTLSLFALPSEETSAQTVTQEAKQAGGRFPTSELGKLPYLYFDSNDLG